MRSLPVFWVTENRSMEIAGDNLPLFLFFEAAPLSYLENGRAAVHRRPTSAWHVGPPLTDLPLTNQISSKSKPDRHLDQPSHTNMTSTLHSNGEPHSTSATRLLVLACGIGLGRWPGMAVHNCRRPPVDFDWRIRVRGLGGCKLPELLELARKQVLHPLLVCFSWGLRCRPSKMRMAFKASCSLVWSSDTWIQAPTDRFGLVGQTGWESRERRREGRNS